MQLFPGGQKQLKGLGRFIRNSSPLILVRGFIGALIIIGCISTVAEGDSTSSQESEPVSIGASLLNERCTVCHSLKWVRQSRKDRGQWEETVSRMVQRGAWLNGGEREVLIEYLVKTYGLD
ncbi:MAG: hypothetical protein JRF02_00935 [Deltaproteobacteria bacterium]|nr:hypothetical protein [Deltaproteobacteria bacterium]